MNGDPGGYRRLARKMLLVTGAALAAVALFNYLVNPFDVWSSRLVHSKFIKSGRDRVSPAYASSAQSPVHTVLVGTSRTRNGFAMEPPVLDGVLNAGIPAGALIETAEVVQACAQRSDVKLILWEAAFFNFGTLWSAEAEPMIVRRIQGDPTLMAAETLFSGLAVKTSYRKLLRSIRGLRREDSWPVPWNKEHLEQMAQAMRRGFREESFNVRFAVRGYVRKMPDYEFVSERMERLQERVSAAVQQGKRVEFYIPPVTEYHLEAIRQGGQWPLFMRWKRQLADIAPVWDFCGYHELARDLPLFRDANHFAAPVGWAMFHVMTEGDDPAELGALSLVREAADRLDPTTADGLLAEQTRAMQERRATGGKYQQLVEELSRTLAAGEGP